MKINKRKDIRIFSALLLLAATILGGYGISFIPDDWVGGHQQNYQKKAQQPKYASATNHIVSAQLDPNAHQQQQRERKVAQLFNDSVQLMQIGHHRQALTLMHDLLKLEPLMPEAHVNLGFIMLNLARFDAAKRSFDYALDINSAQANAYYGLALAAESQDDYLLALSAMRSYIHLTKDDRYLAKARAALWNWQAIISDNSKGNHEQP
mgnify:CR=1 FL=1